MPRSRITVRLLMLAALAIAALLGAFEAGRRWERGSAASASQKRALEQVRAKQFAAIQAMQANALRFEREIAAQQSASNTPPPPPPADNPRPEPSR